MRTPEEQRAYNREYYRRNKHKWPPRTREQQDKYNAERRAKYASDVAVREKAKRQVKEWQQRNPEKRLGQRVRKYGLTAEQYDALLKKQGGCAICGEKESKNKPGERLHVDHDHVSGRVRGLLCGECNRGLGYFRDNHELLERAAAYLYVSRL